MNVSSGMGNMNGCPCRTSKRPTGFTSIGGVFGGGSGDGEGVGEGVGVAIGVSKALVVMSGSTKLLSEEVSTKIVVMSKTVVKTSETLGDKIELMLSSIMEDVGMEDVS